MGDKLRDPQCPGSYYEAINNLFNNQLQNIEYSCMPGIVLGILCTKDDSNSDAAP